MDGFAALLVFVLLALGVWKFSGALNVNFETGFSVLLRTGGVLAICVILLKFDLLSLGQTIPALIGSVIWAFFPALDYWSGQAQFGFSLGEPMSYVRWYSKAAFVLVPSLSGYGLRYAFSR